MALGSDEAGILALALGAAAAIWKFFIRGRQDIRSDKAGNEQQESYGILIDRLESTLEKQGELIDELGKKLDEEIAKRRLVEDENQRQRILIEGLGLRLDQEIDKTREVEEENVKLRLRLKRLEDEIEGLGGNLERNTG